MTTPMHTPFEDATGLAPEAVALIGQQHGHCLQRGLLPAERVATLRVLVERVAEARGWLQDRGDGRWVVDADPVGAGHDDPRWIALQADVIAHPAFSSLAEHPRMLATAAALVGGPVISRQGDIARLGWPHRLGLTTPPHQDHHYIGGTRRAWTAWTPLLPCPPELGPLQVVAQSHRWGPLVHDGSEGQHLGARISPDVDWRAEPLEPGDVVWFHCMTVHGALPNKTDDRLRLSADFRYRLAGAR